MEDEERTTSPHKTVVTEVKAPRKLRAQDPRSACLVVIYGDDLGRRILLGTDPTNVGRSSRCEVQVDQESVSRNHCRVSYDGSRYWVQDLGSTNGTYVNDELVHGRVTLRDGDQLKVGRTILKFLTGSNIETQYHEEIYRLMTVDGLTEVHNKRYFTDALDREISRATRYKRSFSLLVFDIDHFKNINDTFGHLAGDAVLRQLGALVKSRVRRDDTVARVGGEEFAVVLPEVDKSGALDLAETLRKIIAEGEFRFEDVLINVTVSIGVATWSSDLEVAGNLVQAADERLYEAKRSGRNKVCG